MAADDRVESTVIAQQLQCMIDIPYEVAPSVGHTESIGLCAVGLRQDGQPVVLRHKGLGRLLILNHAVDLALQECLNGIGRLGEPLHLCTSLVVLQHRHFRVGGGAQLHTDSAAWQVMRRPNGPWLAATTHQRYQQQQQDSYVYFLLH